MEDREYRNIYAIPANYTDSDKLLGGLLEVRNTVEAVFLVLLVGYPELMWMQIPGTAKVILMTVTLIPLGIVALMGIGGDTLFDISRIWRCICSGGENCITGGLVSDMPQITQTKQKKAGPKSRPVKKRENNRSAESCQQFIPIRDIQNGIIETTDGRYIKILEIEPINFLLRSAEEQFSIISSFASWLKISPVKLQFKSITRKADSNQHISKLELELQQEENEPCRELGKDYVNLIRDVGSREALTRRFFLIFEYEPVAGRRQMNQSYAEIVSTMQTAAQNARVYFGQCGNSIVSPKDETQFMAEMLYMFFNRKSCITEPFEERVNRVVMDTMAAKRNTLGLDPVPHIPVKNFIAPRGIDLDHYNYVVMDGMYYAFLYIKKDGYPNQVRGGWMSSLINAGDGIDIDVNLQRENRSRTLDKVGQRIRLNRTKLRSIQDTSTDFEELNNSIQAGYYIKQGISNHNEDLFYLSVFITVSAGSYEELQWRKQQITDLLKSMDIFVRECSFKQEKALRSVMPLLSLDPTPCLPKKRSGTS